MIQTGELANVNAEQGRAIKILRLREKCFRANQHIIKRFQLCAIGAFVLVGCIKNWLAHFSSSRAKHAGPEGIMIRLSLVRKIGVYIGVA